MKITRDEMFFSKDLIHTLAYVGMFAAAIISVGACKSGIWVAAILAWIVAGVIIGLATISDYKKAELLKNGTRITGKVTATKRVHIKFHLSTYHLADEDVIYPYVVHYQYKVKGETYNGKSQWFWFNPCIPKGTPIKILVDPKNPTRSTVLNPENQGCEKASKTSVYKGYKQDKIEMRGDRAEMSDFPLYLNTVAGGLDCRDQAISGFSFVVKIYAVPVVEIIG